MMKSKIQFVREALMPCLALSLAISSAKGDDGIVFPDDFDYSKGYSMAASGDGGGLNKAITETCFTKAVWKESADGPLVSAQAGKNYFQNGFRLNGPFVAAMTADAASQYLTFAGAKLVLGAGSAGTDPVVFGLWNGNSNAGETGLADASTKPYVFGGEGLVMAGNCYLTFGRHAALAGTLTVLSDDHDSYRVSQTNKTNFLSQNKERWTKSQCSRIEVEDHRNGWSIDIQSELVGDENAFLCFHRSGHSAVRIQNVCQFSGDASGYRGTLAVESNCVFRFKTSASSATVKVGYRGWGMPVSTGTQGDATEYEWYKFNPELSGSGTLDIPENQSVSLGAVENNCGLVRVAAGATLTLGSLAYKGGDFQIASTGSGCGKLAVSQSVSASYRPIRVSVTGVLPSFSNEILAFPADAGLTLSDFSISRPNGYVLSTSTEDGKTKVLLVRNALAEGEKKTVADLDLTGETLTIAISPTVGNSASLTVAGKLTLDQTPLRIGLTGNENAMPQGELVPLLSWRAAENPVLEACDFDFTLSDNNAFGMTGIGRGYPIVKANGDYMTLYLDCSEIMYNATDRTSAPLLSCFTNAAGWADSQMPHKDANYYPGRNVNGIKARGSVMFPDGEIVSYQAFHGNRLRLLRGQSLALEGTGNEFDFPGEGLVLQQGGRLEFADPEIAIKGMLNVASLYTRATASKTVNVSAFANSASNRRTNTRVSATLVGDRRAELTLQMRYTDTKFATNGYDVVFTGDTTGYCGRLICETNTAIFLDTGLPNGTVTLGGQGFPFGALGSLDNDNNGKLSASVSDAVIEISNLEVNGSTVVVSNDNTYALKTLTLNGGKIVVTPKIGSVQIDVAGSVAVTHATKVVMTKLPRSGMSCEVIRWPASAAEIDASLLSVTDAAGRSLDANRYTIGVVADADYRRFVVSKKPSGLLMIVR